MGWTYNTVDPNADTNGPTIAAVGITFTTISLITVCLRMYVRLFMIKAAGAGKLAKENYDELLLTKRRRLDNCVHLGRRLWS